MRITLCVDALQPQLSGIGRYTWELCSRLPHCDGISNLQFYGAHTILDDPAHLLHDRPFRPRRYRGLLRRLHVWQVRRALRSSLVHGPNYFLPLEVETGIITVHDLSVFRFPETHPVERVAAFERLFASSLARATHVITDSETVRRDLIETFSLSPQSVSTVPLGVDEKFRPMPRTEVARAIAQWGLCAGRYGLSVAAMEPRKRIAELIHAWRRLPANLRETYPLVLAGVPGWRNDDLHKQIAAGSAEGWLKHLGYVEEALLPQLYAGARLFIYPSIYEGFGLPPIEAMASGTPVIVSNRSCLPEVCGEAAGYVDPDDVDEFARTIEEALSNGEWRRATIDRGLMRARHFSWDRCIAGTVAVYRSASA